MDSRQFGRGHCLVGTGIVVREQKMIRYWCAIVALFVCVGLVHAEGETPFKVGVVLPLTGELAEYGVAARNGIELAKKERPEIFSNLSFVFDDSQYDSKMALSSFKRLKNVEGVSVVYLWGYGPSQVVASVAEQEKFPLFAVTGDRSVSSDRKYVVRFGYSIENIAKALLAHTRAHNFKKLGVIKTELAYVNGLIEAMKANLDDSEQIELVETFQFGDSDFKTAIAKLRQRKFDSLGVFLIGGQASQFYRQSHKLGYKPQTFGTDFFDSVSVAKDAEGAMEGVVFAGPAYDSGFVARYKETFGNDLQVAWAANSYEFAMLTAELFGKDSSNKTADSVLERYRSASAERGHAARYVYDKSGFDFQVALRRIEVDRIVDVP